MERGSNCGVPCWYSRGLPTAAPDWAPLDSIPSVSWALPTNPRTAAVFPYQYEEECYLLAGQAGKMPWVVVA